VLERHRHRWEFNNDYKRALEDAGLVCAGVYEARGLVEIAELSERPFYIGVQYHPEYKSKPLEPHPLFAAFVGASIGYARGEGEAASTPTTQRAEA
jgi:CTP synthase